MWDISDTEIKSKFNWHKHNAKRRDIECTLTLEEFRQIVHGSEGICGYSSEKMVWGGKEQLPNTCTVERVNDTVKYSASNILLVTHKSNLLKAQVLETKNGGGSKKLNLKERKLLNKICSVVFNPVKIAEIQAKYTNYKTNLQKETIMESKPVEDVITDNKVEELEEFTMSEDVYLAAGYNRLGTLIGRISDFTLTFAQYKRKMNIKRCRLTNITFEKGTPKSFYWVDKTKPFSDDNCLITTCTIQQALDEFTTKTKLSLTELKHLGKVLSSK